MNGRRVVAVASVLAVLAVGGGCTRDRDERRLDEARPRPGDGGGLDVQLISALESFDACDDLLSYLRTEGAKAVGPYGFGGGGFAVAMGRSSAEGDVAATTAEAAAAPAPTTVPVAGEDFSGTNVQEAGVDEPDLVKTDGRRLFTIAGGRLRSLDVTGSNPRLVASLPLGEPYLQGELLLAGDRLLVLHQGGGGGIGIPRPVPGRGAFASPPSPGSEPATTVTVVDVGDAADPKVVSAVSVEGSLVAARMVDGIARVVVRTGTPDLPFLFPSGSAASAEVATEANKRVVAESTLEDWLPSVTVDGGEARRLGDCREVRRPKVFSGFGMLSVFTVDPADPRPGPAATVVGAGELAYASRDHLYVTSTAYDRPEAQVPRPSPSGDAAIAPVPLAPATDIHAFDISDPVRTAYVASGRVAGRLLNGFSMSEHEGHLRVAATDDATQESAVSVLRTKGGALEEVGRVGGLGKDERIYAVRFLGDRGYVVTFRQTDPLYVIDLADPTSPVLRGELKIPGYSAYLHPLGGDRLLGVGQDATEQGRVQGLQLSLFDVSDPASPKRLATAGVPGGRSEAEFDHHAFLWWSRTRLAMVPVQSYTDGSSGAVGFTVADAEIRSLGSVRAIGADPIRRTVVVGTRVLALSESGVVTSDLDTLTRQGELAYG